MNSPKLNAVKIFEVSLNEEVREYFSVEDLIFSLMESSSPKLEIRNWDQQPVFKVEDRGNYIVWREEDEIKFIELWDENWNDQEENKEGFPIIQVSKDLDANKNFCIYQTCDYHDKYHFSVPATGDYYLIFKDEFAEAWPLAHEFLHQFVTKTIVALNDVKNGKNAEDTALEMLKEKKEIFFSLVKGFDLDPDLIDVFEDFTQQIEEEIEKLLLDAEYEEEITIEQDLDEDYEDEEIEGPTGMKG